MVDVSADVFRPASLLMCKSGVMVDYLPEDTLNSVIINDGPIDPSGFGATSLKEYSHNLEGHKKHETMVGGMFTCGYTVKIYRRNVHQPPHFLTTWHYRG
ncbi:unnamed protein product [Dicrocoelium dendriticum]|nr:unnamed protein product [Dicrocoelium dendriticum]